MLVLFVLAIVWLPWVVLGTAALFIALYAWDSSVEPLHIETTEEVAEERKSNRQALVVVGIVLFSVVVYFVNET